MENAAAWAEVLGWSKDTLSIYAAVDADGIPTACACDPLVTMLSDEQKRELLTTDKQKFIALLIKRNEQKFALIDKLELDDFVIVHPEVIKFLYELLYLSDEDIAQRIVDLAHEIPHMEGWSV